MQYRAHELLPYMNKVVSAQRSVPQPLPLLQQRIPYVTLTFRASQDSSFTPDVQLVARTAVTCLFTLKSLSAVLRYQRVSCQGSLLCEHEMAEWYIPALQLCAM